MTVVASWQLHFSYWQPTKNAIHLPLQKFDWQLPKNAIVFAT
jgi:hypothetical protein